MAVGQLGSAAVRLGLFSRRSDGWFISLSCLAWFGCMLARVSCMSVGQSQFSSKHFPFVELQLGQDYFAHTLKKDLTFAFFF